MIEQVISKDKKPIIAPQPVTYNPHIDHMDSLSWNIKLLPEYYFVSE